VVKAFLSHPPGEAFADRIGSGSVIRGAEHFNSTRCRHPSETGSKFTIVITDQILRCLPVGRGCSQLLRHPGIARRPCDASLDHSSGLKLDDEEREKWSKEKISHLQEVTSPDVRCVIVQKRRPLLSSWSWCFASLRWFRGLCSQDASFSRTLSTIGTA
jgi:hypothetical protein